MRIVFFGTGAFGLPTLEAIQRWSGGDLCGIVTGPDKPQGRGRRLAPTPVAVWAQQKGVQPVLKPERLRDPALVESLRVLQAHVFAVVAYRVLPESVFTLPSVAINLHASLLPAYRGPAPIQRAIMAGETRTGVTTFILQKKVDRGGILLQRATGIGAEENAGELAARLADLGATLMIDTLSLIAGGDFQPLPQDDTLASSAPKIMPCDRQVCFEDEPTAVINRVRALAPKPGAVAKFRGQQVKLLSLRDLGALPGHADTAVPGTILEADPRRRLVVAVGGHSVEFRSLQPQGKRPQTGCEFVRGYRLKTGELFENA